jgi:hypothetical protein
VPAVLGENDMSSNLPLVKVTPTCSHAISILASREGELLLQGFCPICEEPIRVQFMGCDAEEYHGPSNKEEKAIPPRP